jgi:LysM repeat protein
MKHLLYILTALFYTINISSAQTGNYETRIINGKQNIIYHVKAGETWASIAQKLGISERSLIDQNKQTNGSLKGVTTLKVLMDKSTKSTSSVIIKNTETEAPVELNSLPKFGDEIEIKKTKTEKPKIYGQELRTEYRGANSLAVYKIGAGDNINDLAKYYNCKVEEIITQNNLVSNTLTAGKILKIPIQTSTNENSTAISNKDIVQETIVDIQLNSNEKTNTIEKSETTQVLEPNEVNQNYVTRTIRGKEYIIYEVKPKDTWKSIATKFDVIESRLKSVNIQTNGSLVGVKTIKIPSEKTALSKTNITQKSNGNSENNLTEAEKLKQKYIEDNSEKESPNVTINNKTETNNNINAEEPKIQLKANETIIGNYLVLKKLNKLFIKHVVISGEDLTRVSKEHYTTFAKVVSANNLKITKLHTGQILFLPTNKQVLFKLTGLDFDEVEKSKNEQKSIDNNNVSYRNIKYKSNVSENNISDTSTRYNWGDPLILKPTILDSNAKKTALDLSKEINANELHANSNSGETKTNYTHSVLAGESIDYIAKKYKISISDISNWNNLYQNRIRVGQDLIVNLNRARKPYLSINSVSPESNKQIKNFDKSDRVKNVEERGLCLLIDENFIGVAHKSVPVGTLLLLTSTENFKKIYVRVTSILENSNADIVLQVDKTVAKQLAFNSSLTNILLSYSLVD